jgi:alkanesulfonate monooxygenase SsuD/methylene tetrahydromethanopterin reductase-like flavin-dependent oxidoreductase (luciferase family)
MLDHLSRGRYEFGTGIGVSEHEFIRWKLPFHERRQMSEEALEIILKCWTQEEVTYEGKYWQFDEALPVPKPYRQPHPPVWVAAHSPSALEFAVRSNYHVSQNMTSGLRMAWPWWELRRRLSAACRRNINSSTTISFAPIITLARSIRRMRRSPWNCLRKT